MSLCCHLLAFERGRKRGGEGKCMPPHQESPQRREAGYQVQAGRSPALVTTPVPSDPKDRPIHLLLWSPAPHPGWQPGGQTAQHGRLSVLALGPADNPLAQRLEIKGQEGEGHRLRTNSGGRGRRCKYRDSDIKLRILKAKASGVSLPRPT